MLKYLISERQGRFLSVGILLTIFGFAMSSINNNLSTYLFYIAIVFLGYYATKNAVVDTIKNKSPNVDLLMILAALGAILIDYASEGAMLLIIFAGAEVLENYVTGKSSSAIKELMKQLPDEAKRITNDGNYEIVSTDALKIGDKVLVSKGDQLPIDGLVDRDSTINESSLTGESVPVTKSKGDGVFAGTINEGNSFVIEVSKEKKDTVFSNIIRMVEQAQNRPSKKSKIIDKIESSYVIAVLIIVPIFILALYYLSGFSFEDAFYRGIVLLTVASPCALVASATPATLSAISNGAKNGILFKDGRAMEILSDVDIIGTDKTGTLTYGEFEVVDYKVDEEILKYIVYIEHNSNHPIAQGIVNKFKDLDISKVKESNIEEIAGKGVQMDDIKVGKKSMFEGYKDTNNYLEIENEGNTISFISKANEVVGYIALSDKVRETAKEAIKDFHKDKVIIEMLTGDNQDVATKVAKYLNINHYRSGLNPEDKMKFIENKMNDGKTVAMIGDGINDAPALANADIGISMGSGTSIAMESSDIVIVQNDLNKLYHSFKLSKRLNSIIYQNIIFSVAVIIILIALNLFGILDLPLGVVFHEGSTILVILNGLRLLGFKNI